MKLKSLIKWKLKLRRSLSDGENMFRYEGQNWLLERKNDYGGLFLEYGLSEKIPNNFCAVE